MVNVMFFTNCLAAIAMMVGSVARAEVTVNAASQPPGGLSLVRAISLSLQKNPDIKISETLVTISQGGLQAAGAPFDPLVNVGANVTETLEKFRSTNTTMGVSQQLRSGVVLGASLTAQSENTYLNPAPASAASLGVSITFPMLRGREQANVTAAENVARLALQKTEYDRRHAVSFAIYSTALAYWNLRTAEEVLAVQRESEARAQQMVGDIQRLIKSDERPAADLNLINANLTGRRTARLTAEQDLINARLALGEKIGLNYSGFHEVAGASDSFPGYDEKMPLIKNGPELVQKAAENRFDLKATRINLDALRLAVSAAQDNLKPLLSLTVGANFVGRSNEENPLLVLSGRVRDPQLVAGLTYTWDVVNSKSKGDFLSRSALLDQQLVATSALQLTISVGVERAVAGYNRSTQQLAESQRAVDLYSKIVENERTKLKIGSATLLDVVNVESQRQDALLDHINQRAAYAIAIAALRYQTGELILDSPNTQLFSVEQLKAYRPSL